MLSEQERRALETIENAISYEDPRLARLLAKGPRRRPNGAARWVAIAAVPPVVVGLIHPGLGVMLLFVMLLAFVMVSVLTS